MVGAAPLVDRASVAGAVAAVLLAGAEATAAGVVGVVAAGVTVGTAQEAVDVEIVGAVLSAGEISEACGASWLEVDADSSVGGTVAGQAGAAGVMVRLPAELELKEPARLGAAPAWRVPVGAARRLRLGFRIFVCPWNSAGSIEVRVLASP